jgi:hypothetical protein
MESVKTHFDLSDVIPSQHFFKTDRIHPKNSNDTVGGISWVVDGVAFPNGTEFRCKYKGYCYYAQVCDGALMINGKKFLSPSAAAVSITRNAVDGWLFWDCKLPGDDSWVAIYEFK